MPAWADPEAFEVRASPAFVGREAFCQTTGVNLGAFAYARDGNDTISEGSYASLANAEFDPTAEDAPESYTFTCNGWTATVSLATMVQRRDSHVVALSFSPPAGQNNPTLDLLVADAYATHALALVQIVNGTPVATALSVGEKFWINPSLSFTRATVPFDPTLTFRVVDGNTGARGPFGSTLVADAWTDGPGNDAFRAVTFYLDASESGLRYTLHSQASGPEILRSLVAVQCSEAQQGQQTIGDFTTEDETGAVCITGFVPIGGYYWVTRDLDGACIESRMLDPNLSYPTPLQWSLRGQHALPPPMQVITLHVAATNGSALSIHQDSAERSVTLADETVYTIEDYDAWGNPHPFYYRNFTATVNIRETWWLMQGSTQLNAGDIWLYDGWSPMGGVAQDRQAVTFGIASGFGAHAWVTDTSGTGGLTLAGANQRIDDYNEDGSPNHFYYDLWSATVDVSRPFYLNIGDGAGNLVAQMPANELWFMNNWQAIGGMPVNNQLVTFVVPHGVEQLWVWQAGTTDLTFKVRGHIEDYFNDDEGAPNFFEYDEYTASVDVNRPYYLMVDGVTLADHETTCYGSWVRQGGVKPHHFTLSLTLHGSRAAHNFSIREPDGTLWGWAPSGTTEPATLTLPDAWDASGTQPPWELDTEILISEWRHRYSGQNGTWTISDDTTGQSQHFNPGTAAAYTLNLGGWFTAATGFPVTASLSRWSHVLRIMDRAGGNYSVDRIASQGSTTTFGFEGAWYESYFYYDATAHRALVPGLEWRLYDATAKEFAPFDPEHPADYTNWHYTPAPAHVTGTQTALNTLDLTWDFATPPGGSPAGDSTELLAGSFTVKRFRPATQEWVIVQDGLASSFRQSPATAPLAFHHTEAAMPPGTYTYRLTYSYGGQDSAIVERTFTVLPLVTYYGLTPFNLTASQVRLDAIYFTWILPAVPGIDTTQGFFTIVRTAARGGAPVTFIRQATVAGNVGQWADGTLHGYFVDEPLLEDDYTYVASYTYAGAQGPAASVTGTVFDAATLDTIYVPGPWGGSPDWRKLDLILFYMGYWGLGMQSPDGMVVQPGATRTFDVSAAGSIGPLRIALSPQQNNLFGTFTSEQISQRTIRITYTANNTYKNRTEGGWEYIGFVVSDSCRSHFHVAIFEIVPTALAPSQSSDWRVLNGEFSMLPWHVSLSGTLPVIRGQTPLVIKVFDPNEGSVTLDDASTGVFTYSGSGNAFFSYAVREQDADEEDPASYHWGTIYVHAPPTTHGPNDPNDGGPNADTESAWIDVDAMKGVVGDVIPSTMLRNGVRHFVSPKLTPQISNPTVVLTAHVHSSTGKTIGNGYYWIVDGVSSTNATVAIARNSTGQHYVAIINQATNQEVDEIYVWIVWATKEPARVPGAPVFNQSVVGSDGVTRSQFRIDRDVDPWTFKWSIEPSAIFNLAADVPKLDGRAAKTPPGAYQAYQPDPSKGKQDDAQFKWDVSRRMHVDVYNPGISFAQLADEYMQVLPATINGESVALDYPSENHTGGNADAAGNDDPPDDTLSGAASEDDDPYHARQIATPKHWLNHAVGQLTSFDAPRFGVRKAWASNPYLPVTFFQWKASFVEFARLELWDGTRTGGKIWFPISDTIEWHHYLRAFWLFYGGEWLDLDSHSGLGSAPP